jgi:transposase
MLKGKKKIHIEMTDEKLHQLIDEIENSNLTEETRQELINSLRALIELDRLVGLKSATIARLRKIFGKQSEKTQPKDPQEKKPAHGHTGGSGRHGQDHYPSASIHHHEIVNLKEKDTCPDCQKGKVYKWNPGIYVRVSGNLPLSVSVHKTQNLRCNLCGKIFEAEFIGKGEEKFDAQAKAMIAILHYKSSLPFYRLEKLQDKLGLPVPRSTLWTQIEKLANQIILVWKVMVQKASNGDLFYIDDTKARILSLMSENELQEPNTKTEPACTPREFYLKPLMAKSFSILPEENTAERIWKISSVVAKVKNRLPSCQTFST